MPLPGSPFGNICIFFGRGRIYKNVEYRLFDSNNWGVAGSGVKAQDGGRPVQDSGFEKRSKV